MTLEQLKTFCAVVDQGGFRAAADKLYRSQSAVSIAIRNLENTLQVKLFLRDQYRPVLTDEGRSLYDKARSVLSRAEEFMDMAHHFSIGEEPNLRIAMSAVAPVERIMDVLNQIKQIAPATKITLLVESLNGTMERLDDGDVDIAITETFDADKSGYQHVVISQVEFISIVSPEFSSSDQVHQITEQDLQDSTQIIVRDTSRVVEKKTAGVVDTMTQWVVNDFTMKKRIIASGMGWGRMPKHMVNDDIDNGDFIVLSAEEFAPIKVNVKMVRRKNKARGPVQEKLWSMMQNISPEI